MLYKKGVISLFYIQHLFMLPIPLPLKPSPIIINKINIIKIIDHNELLLFDC